MVTTEWPISRLNEWHHGQPWTTTMGFNPGDPAFFYTSNQQQRPE